MKNVFIILDPRSWLDFNLRVPTNRRLPCLSTYWRQRRFTALVLAEFPFACVEARVLNFRWAFPTFPAWLLCNLQRAHALVRTIVGFNVLAP